MPCQSGFAVWLQDAHPARDTLGPERAPAPYTNLPLTEAGRDPRQEGLAAGVVTGRPTLTHPRLPHSSADTQVAGTLSVRLHRTQLPPSCTAVFSCAPASSQSRYPNHTDRETHRAHNARSVAKRSRIDLPILHPTKNFLPPAKNWARGSSRVLATC